AEMRIVARADPDVRAHVDETLPAARMIVGTVAKEREDALVLLDVADAAGRAVEIRDPEIRLCKSLERDRTVSIGFPRRSDRIARRDERRRRARARDEKARDDTRDERAHAHRRKKRARRSHAGEAINFSRSRRPEAGALHRLAPRRSEARPSPR